jgi:hypothetical protein
MEWIDAESNPPSAYKDYVCLAEGKMIVATFREHFYDLKRPHWSADGVTYYLAGVPTFPAESAR